MQDDLLLALSQSGTTVYVANNVDMDLGNRENITIAAGVKLIGGRAGLEPGPRLFTTRPLTVTRPRTFLKIVGDDVRITGMRIQGPDFDSIVNIGQPAGIFADSHRGIEIDHNEISGWNGAAVELRDQEGRVAAGERVEALSIRVHDNFIHHNQHIRTRGYGVVVAEGAYAQIERNVFDYNRHAIAGDGKPGTAYAAFENLVLPHGGKHYRFAQTVWFYTHQFDMHGRGERRTKFSSPGRPVEFSCAPPRSGGRYNCGPAGEFMDIIFNSFIYKAGAAIKLRGTPSRKPVGALISNNVFADGPDAVKLEMLAGGMRKINNRYGLNGLRRLGLCDFDGDGINDSFLATGQTWWYSSGTRGPWTFLDRSRKLLSEVVLGDVDHDGRCDVQSRDGVIKMLFDLNGDWTDGGTAAPVISIKGDKLTIDMSAHHRPTARGSIINSETIKVTFPDDATYTGTLQTPDTIKWSNGSTWTKVVA
jgi:hypothetical protein